MKSRTCIPVFDTGSDKTRIHKNERSVASRLEKTHTLKGGGGTLCEFIEYIFLLDMLPTFSLNRIHQKLD